MRRTSSYSEFCSGFFVLEIKLALPVSACKRANMKD
jgi:hypothetical protein